MRLGILAFATGIALLQGQPVLPAWAWLVGLSLLGASGLWLAWRRSSVAWRGVALLACVVLGFSWAAWRAQLRLADQLPEAWESRDVEVIGVVAALPQRFERGERFVFDVESVISRGASVPSRIALSWYHPWDELEEGSEAVEARAVHPGERWRFTVRLKRPHGNANPQGFDYEAWLLERGIRATGTIRARAGAERQAAFVWQPAYVVERLRDAIRARFLATLPDAPYVGVLIALTVGDQRAIPNAQWQVFNRTGVTHLVSISGLHVTMIAALFAAAINLLWRRSERLMLWLLAQKAAVLAGWLAALAYALLAGFEVPAQRTFYMLSVVALALWSGRNFGVSRTLLLAMLTVLLLDPWAVMATGFWLSFGAVALLFYVSTARAGIGMREGWRSALARWGVAQWAVTIGSLPLLIFFFQQFSLVSPLSNAVAIPLVSFVITPLALIFGAMPWPPLLQFDHWLLSQLMRLLDALAGFPVWQQAAPPWWATVLAVLGVGWLLLPRGFPARWLGLCLMLPALTWLPPRPVKGEAWLEVLDVGQGLAVVVRTASHTLLFDTGPLYSAEANAGQRVLVPYLRSVGVQQLDTLIVSHRDKDHAGGAQAIRDALPVRRSLSSMDGAESERCVAGQRWEWDGVRFSVLHPVAADYSAKLKQPNNLSCVLRVEAAGSSALLTADIEAPDEVALIAHAARAGKALRSDVLLVPHHGGRGSSTPDFIAAVAPQHAVISAGYRNAFGHPRQDVLERYAGSQRWRTDRDGAIRVVLGSVPGESSVASWRAERPRYWHLQ